MNQNIYFNIFLLLVILLIIKYISPDPDSVLYVLKKYLNFLIFKINNFLKNLFNCNENFIETNFIGRTFNGIKKFNDKAPSFVTYHQKIFIQKMMEINPKLEIITLKKLYNFIEKLVSTDTDDYFMTVSDSNPKIFTENEINKIKNIIMNKLNSGVFVFTNIDIKDPIVYYDNFSGREINPFSFSVNCKNIGKLNIFIEIDIRNDIVRNSSYLVIKKIRINIDTNLKNHKIINFNIEDDVTNKIIYNDINLDVVPETCTKKNHPKSFDDPMNINMKYSSYEIPTNYNIDFNDIEIPNYDDIINGYDDFNEQQNIKINNIIPSYSEQNIKINNIIPSYSEQTKNSEVTNYNELTDNDESNNYNELTDNDESNNYNELTDNDESNNYNELLDNSELSSNSKEYLRSNDVLYNSKNNSNEIFSIQMPLLDFSREYIPIRTKENNNIEAVNSNESSNNMLDNLSSFKIPKEPERSKNPSKNDEFNLAQQYSSSSNY